MKSIISTFYIIAFTLTCFISLAQNNSQNENIALKDHALELLEKSRTNIKNDLYYEARKQLDDALKLAKDLNDNKLTGRIYYEIGKLLLIFKEYDGAELSFRKAILKQELLNEHTNLGKSYIGLGDIYLNLYKYATASKYYQEAVDYFNLANDVNNLLYAHLKKGISHYHLDEFSDALNDLDICISKGKSKNNQDILSAAYVYKGHIESRITDLDQGKRTSYKGFVIAEEENYTDVLKNSYFIISEIEGLAGETEKSIFYLKKHIRFNDSLNAVKSNKLSADKRLEFLSNNQTEYFKEKIETVEALESSKAINKATTMLSIALITILSLFTISLYKNNSIRKKTNSILSGKNKELLVAKEKAELATKAKANFLSTVTHELRTPLYAVTGLTNMLLEEDPKKEQLEHLKSLKFSGDYLLTFINDILEVNKIEAQKTEVEAVSFNLKNKINNIILALNNAQPQNNVKIHLDYDENLPTHFILDQVKISQILINLIGNSIKFTKNGDVWVRVIKQNKQGKLYNIRFEVEDNGIGISKEKQESIFESFSQGSVAINRKYGGTGLGLSIVKGLVEVLGGQINIESTLHKGTKFYFDLEVKKSLENKTISYFENVDENELNKIKILIVEDNKINQMITQKTLKKMHIKSDVIDNGTDAIEMVKNNNYSAVLMDIHMAGISGMEATKQIREFNKDLLIFALTAVTIDDKIKEFVEQGFNDVIPKPFKQEVFERILYTELTKSKFIS